MNKRFEGKGRARDRERERDMLLRKRVQWRQDDTDKERILLRGHERAGWREKMKESK